jgi:hypothetical protein
MKQLQLNEMQTIRGGSWACLGPGLSVMGALGWTGVGALFVGVAVYSICSYASSRDISLPPVSTTL